MTGHGDASSRRSQVAEMNTPLTIKKPEINLNTIAIIVGFITTIVTISYFFSNLQNEQKNFGGFVLEQKAVNARFDERISTNAAALEALPQMNYQVAQLEAADKNSDDRIGRITESYGNRFTEFTTQLAAIATQVALVQQSLVRIEAWRDRDRREATSSPSSSPPR